MKILIILILMTTVALADDLPNSTLTPGTVLQTVPDEKTAKCLSDVSGSLVQVHDAITLDLICRRGYSKCIRHVPHTEMMAMYHSYGLADVHAGYCVAGCEADHLISIELGGANVQTNLWPQPYQGVWNAHRKDRLEDSLHAQVCKGQIPLAQAQQEIATDWIASYQKHFRD